MYWKRCSTEVKKLRIDGGACDNRWQGRKAQRAQTWMSDGSKVKKLGTYQAQLKGFSPCHPPADAR